MKKWLLGVGLVAFWAVSMVYVFGFGALVAQFDVARVESFMARSAKALFAVAGRYEPCGGKPALECGFHDTRGRELVNCADYTGPGAAVLMTYGQSNSANAGKDRYIPVGPVANFNPHDSKCYKAEDPLLGPDAYGGSVWGVLGDKLIAGGHYERVLVIPFGIGGSAIAQWLPDGNLHPILARAAQRVNERGLVPTHVLWHQGESDAGLGTSERAYFDRFTALLASLRGYGIDAPVYPAIATYCRYADPEVSHEHSPAQQAVRAAQARLPELPGVRPGPDTVTIVGRENRHDNCHFNARGMQAHAQLWLQAIAPGEAG